MFVASFTLLYFTLFQLMLCSICAFDFYLVDMILDFDGDTFMTLHSNPHFPSLLNPLPLTLDSALPRKLLSRLIIV